LKPENRDWCYFFCNQNTNKLAILNSSCLPPQQGVCLAHLNTNDFPDISGTAPVWLLILLVLFLNPPVLAVASSGEGLAWWHYIPVAPQPSSQTQPLPEVFHHGHGP
jgi:hypothetical protein